MPVPFTVHWKAGSPSAGYITPGVWVDTSVSAGRPPGEGGGSHIPCATALDFWILRWGMHEMRNPIQNNGI